MPCSAACFCHCFDIRSTASSTPYHCCISHAIDSPCHCEYMLRLSNGLCTVEHSLAGDLGDGLCLLLGVCHWHSVPGNKDAAEQHGGELDYLVCADVSAQSCWGTEQGVVRSGCCPLIFANSAFITLLQWIWRVHWPPNDSKLSKSAPFRDPTFINQ